jgi:hypothetical protein
MTKCIGCCRWYTYFCSYVAFNKMIDPEKFMLECPCTECLVKVTCKGGTCSTLHSYFLNNLKYPSGVKYERRRFSRNKTI